MKLPKKGDFFYEEKGEHTFGKNFLKNLLKKLEKCFTF